MENILFRPKTLKMPFNVTWPKQFTMPYDI